MLKKILCFCLMLCLGTVLCACGNKDGTASVNSSDNFNSASVDASSSGATVGEQSNADAILTVEVTKGNITKFKSNRPYDKSKEDISLILVVGQSNFTSSVGYSCEYGALVSGKTTVEPEAPTLPTEGTVYSSRSTSSITSLTADRDVSTLCDISKKSNTMGGVTPSFGTEWHNLTGTKVVFVQAAVGAVGVHEWVPNPEDYYCTCKNNGGGVLYSRAVSNFKASYAALSKEYNIVYTGYIWNQGEHENGEYASAELGSTVCSDATYYDAYKSMHDGFMNELDLDFGGISVVRQHGGTTATDSKKYTVARAAQYKLCNDIDNLYMLSTISETTSPDMMDQSNTIHYSQMIFNLMGYEMAQNLYSRLGLGTTNEYSGIEMYSSLGTLVCSFDKDGKLLETVAGDDGLLIKANFTDHIITKVTTLGTNHTLNYKVMVGGKDVTESCIDEFGKFDWTTLSQQFGVKTVAVNCVNK